MLLKIDSIVLFSINYEVKFCAVKQKIEKKKINKKTATKAKKKNMLICEDTTHGFKLLFEFYT